MSIKSVGAGTIATIGSGGRSGAIIITVAITAATTTMIEVMKSYH